MRRPPLACWIPLALALLSCSGCIEFYWCQTTVSSDGTIERAIYQPADSLTDARKDGWANVIDVRKVPSGADWPESFEALVPVEQREDASYVAARGRFPQASEIPDHVVFTSPDGQQARLERQYERRDHGFFVEHVWTETLTDTFDLTDMLKARQELAQRVLHDAEQVAERAYGAELEMSAVFAWARDDGVRWFNELIDAMVATANQPDRDAAFQRRFVEISARYGLDLRGPDGQFLIGSNDELLAERFRSFCRLRLRALLRDQHKQEISDARLTQLLDELLPRDSADEHDKRTPSRLHVETEGYIREKYGDPDRYTEQMVALTARICGVHQTRIGARHFRYVVELPGLMVETSGSLLDEHRALFEFEARHAFPFGYRMTCRSLEPIVAAQTSVLGAARITDRAGLVELQSLLAEDEALADAVRTAVEQKSRQPIQTRLEQGTELTAPQEASLRRLLGW